MNPRNFAFRRNTAIDPVVVPATDVASKVTVPDLRTQVGVTSFGVDNAYPIYIRLVGTGYNVPFNSAAEGKSWLFGPGKHGPFTTQFPEFMSAIAVDRPGFPIKDGNGNLLYPTAALEVFYGSGSGGFGGAPVPLVSVRNPVTVGNFPATQPVSGTFWQATQPVSGTFWQSVQPVIDRGSATILTKQITLAATPVQVLPARAGRRKVTLGSDAGAGFFFGPPGVTSTTGYNMAGGGAHTLDTAAEIWAGGQAGKILSVVEFFG